MVGIEDLLQQIAPIAMTETLEVRVESAVEVTAAVAVLVVVAV